MMPQVQQRTLGRGFLTGRYRSRLSRFQKEALAQGDQIIPIPGTKPRTYLDENLGSLEVTLSQADLQELNHLPSAVGERN